MNEMAPTNAIDQAIDMASVSIKEEPEDDSDATIVDQTEHNDSDTTILDPMEDRDTAVKQEQDDSITPVVNIEPMNGEVTVKKEPLDMNYDFLVKEPEQQQICRCHVCHRVFKSPLSLKLHFKAHTASRLYSCKICGKSFQQHPHLVYHLATHDAPNSYDCSFCERNFKYWSSLKKHVRERHPSETLSKLYKCSECSAEFDKFWECRKHEMAHKVEKMGIREQPSTIVSIVKKEEVEKPKTPGKHVCVICQRAFVGNKDLVRHMRVHTDEKPYSCCICNKRFRQKHHVNSHMLTHTGEKTHFCPYCDDKAFTSSCALKKHVRCFHPGLKAFRCVECGTQFQKAWELKKHLYKHKLQSQGIDPDKIPCKICNKTFPSYFRLRHHERLHKRVYNCSLCNEVFENPYKLSIHQRVHNVGDYSCDKCDRKFRFKWNHALHVKACVGKLIYKCRKCKIEFTNKSDRNEHYEAAHRKQSTCLICKQEFEKLSNLMEHYESHKTSKGYQCPVCQKFFGLNGLGVHMKIHDKDLRCPVCLKEFQLPYKLTLHMRSHTNPFTCDKCGKTFSSNQKLQIHGFRHTGIRPYKCTYCSKSFVQNFSLKQHMKKHTGEKVVCDICQKEFTQQSSLYAHKLQVHSTIKKHSCSYCGKRFALRQKLKIHERSHTGQKNYKCNKCGRGLTSAQSLRNHMHSWHQGKTPFTCEHCQCKFVSQAQLTEHQRSHTVSMSFGCYICGRFYNTKETLATHLRKQHPNEKPPNDLAETVRVNIPSDDMWIKQDPQSFDPGKQPKRRKPIEPSMKTFTCPSCSRQFSSKQSLGVHVRRKHGAFSASIEVNSVCKVEKTDPDSNGLPEAPEEMHPPKKLFNCKFCPKSFTSGQALGGHVRFTHRNEWMMNRPSKVEPGSSPMESQSAVTEQPAGVAFECKFCPKSFPSEHMLRIHVEHHVTGNNVCKLEPKDSTSESSFNITQKTRSVIKLATCAICSRNFVSEHGLKIHMKLKHKHDENGSVAGPQKSGAEDHFSVLQAIQERESSLKKFKCVHCSKMLSSAQGLKVHVKLKHLQLEPGSSAVDFHSNINPETHGSIKILNCEFCPKRFNSKEALGLHITRKHIHDKVIKIEPRDSSSGSHPEITQEVNRQMFQCMYCPKKLPSAHGLKVHIKFKHVKEGKICKIEPLDSENQDIQEINSSKKFYVCRYCSRCFSSEHGFKVHVVLKHNIKHITLSIHHEKRPDFFHCSDCVFGFSSVRALEAHMKIH